GCEFAANRTRSRPIRGNRWLRATDARPPSPQDRRALHQVCANRREFGPETEMHTDSHTVVVEAAAPPMQGLRYGPAAPGRPRLLPPLTAASQTRPTHGSSRRGTFEQDGADSDLILLKSRGGSSAHAYRVRGLHGAFASRARISVGVRAAP